MKLRPSQPSALQSGSVVVHRGTLVSRAIALVSHGFIPHPADERVDDEVRDFDGLRAGKPQKTPDHAVVFFALFEGRAVPRHELVHDQADVADILLEGALGLERIIADGVLVGLVDVPFDGVAFGVRSGDDDSLSLTPGYVIVMFIYSVLLRLLFVHRALLGLFYLLHGRQQLGVVGHRVAQDELVGPPFAGLGVFQVPRRNRLLDPTRGG